MYNNNKENNVFDDLEHPMSKTLKDIPNGYAFKVNAFFGMGTLFIKLNDNDKNNVVNAAYWVVATVNPDTKVDKVFKLDVKEI